MKIAGDGIGQVYESFDGQDNRQKVHSVLDASGGKEPEPGLRRSTDSWVRPVSKCRLTSLGNRRSITSHAGPAEAENRGVPTR